MTCMHMTQTSILLLTDLGPMWKDKIFSLKVTITVGCNAIKQQLAESRRNHGINILLVQNDKVASDTGLFIWTQFLRDYSILSGWCPSKMYKFWIIFYFLFPCNYASLLNMQPSLSDLLSGKYLTAKYATKNETPYHYLSSERQSSSAMAHLTFAKQTFLNTKLKAST